MFFPAPTVLNAFLPHVDFSGRRVSDLDFDLGHLGLFSLSLLFGTG